MSSDSRETRSNRDRDDSSRLNDEFDKVAQFVSLGDPVTGLAMTVAGIAWRYANKKSEEEAQKRQS